MVRGSDKRVKSKMTQDSRDNKEVLKMERITWIFTIAFFIISSFAAIAQPVGENLAKQRESKPVIAVTTFENLSAYPQNAWVAMSFSESLTTKLKHLYERFRVVERIRVYDVIRERGLDAESVSRIPSQQQQELGTLLGARYLVVGSVSLTGSADNLKTPLLANVRTVDVQTGEIKESEAIRGEMEKLFDLEIQLAYALLKQMGIEPTPEEAEKLNLKETLSILANKYYSLGQKAFYDGDYETAKSLYDKALEVLGGEYYQAAELSLIEALEHQKAAADEAQKAQIKAEARRRREESERKRSEANQRLFAEAKYSMLAEDYEIAIERFQEYLNLAKPFRQIKWMREFRDVSRIGPTLHGGRRIAYRPILHEGVARNEAIYVASFDFKSYSDDEGGHNDHVFHYVFHLDAMDPKTGEVRWQFEKREEPKNSDYSGSVGGGSVGGRIVRPEGPELRSPIVIVDGTIYAPMDNTHIVALDENTGELMWEFERGKREDARIGDEHWPFPQVTDGVVCVKFYDGMLVALSAKTGELKWQFDTGIRSERSVLVSDGRVYVVFREGLIALSAQNGKELWRAKLETLRSPWSRLVLMDKASVEQSIAELKAQFKAVPDLSEERAKALEEFLESLLQPFNKLDGQGLLVIEDKPQTGLRQGDVIFEVDGTPITDVKQFVAVIRSKELPTIRTLKILRGGKEKSLTVEETDEPPSEEFPPAIQCDSDILYAVTSGMYGSISALKKATGESLWEYRASPMFINRLALEGKRLYAYSYDGIYVLGTERGELLWKAKGERPLLANERVYMLDWQGLSGRALETGEVIWQAKLREPRARPELRAVTETTVYLSSSSENLQKLHALDAKTEEELWQLSFDAKTIEDFVKDVLVGEDGTVYLTTQHRLYALSPKPKGLLPEQEEHESLLGIGTALVALGRYEEAIPKLKEALELRADLTGAVWQLALAYEGMHWWASTANERNEYLSRTSFASVRPEVKKHLYEHFGIQKWALRGEPEFDIRRYIPDDTSHSVSKMAPGLRWGGAATLTFMEGTLFENGSTWWRVAEEWGKVEVLGRTAIRLMKLSSGWHPSRPWSGEESAAQRFSDSGRIYMSFILMDEMEDTEGEEEYHVTSILGAFSVETGELLWKFETDLGSRPTKQFFIPILLVSDLIPPFEKGGLGGIYWGLEGRLYALDKETGALQWEFHDETTPQLFMHGPSIGIKGNTETQGGAQREQTALVAAEGSVYIVDREGLFALSAQTGKLLWKNPIPNLRSPVRVRAGRVYALAGRELYALGADTGETDWKIKTDSDLKDSQCVLDGERVYLRTYGST